MSATVWAYPWDLVDEGAALAAKGAGIQHITFYNYGVLPQARLAWLAEAARAFRS